MSLKKRIGWLALVGLIVSRAALAALGGDVASISEDRVQIKASGRIVAADRYTVHEMVTPAGTTVREYAGAGGQVFAVTWSGPSMPDLRQLLGAYFGDYATAGHADAEPASAHAPGTNHAHRSLRRSGLVVHSTGHQRAFSGKAYLPSMIPTGVVIDALR